MKTRKLSVPEQIQKMKSEGIKFSIMNEGQAEAYLKNNSYYFRIKAFQSNYDCHTDKTTGILRYNNLEFAYLAELSKIDMLFRNIVLSMALDIEHFCKNNLVNDVTREKYEDGVSIISEVFDMEALNESLRRKKNVGVCRDLIKAYENDWAVWSLLEVLSFSEMRRLYEYFYKKHPEYHNVSSRLFSVQYLRNAAAHNNCLLNSLKNGYSSDSEIMNESVFNHIINMGFIETAEARTKKEAKGEYVPTSEKLKKKMKNHVINDFIVMIVAYNEIVTSRKLRERRMAELKALFDERMAKNGAFFKGNDIVVSSYRLVKSFIDFYAAKCI